MNEPGVVRREGGAATPVAQASPGPLPAILVVLAMAAAALAGAMAHWSVLSSNALRGFDTRLMVSSTVRDPSWARAKQAFNRTVNGAYQPLSLTSLMLDAARSGKASTLRAYHQTNLLLHAANAALAVLFLYLLLRHVWAAGLAGLLFALHPLTVETTASISQRAVLLATFFCLFSLTAYVWFARRGGVWRYLLCLLAFIASLCCGPWAIGLPVILLLLDWYPLGRIRKQPLMRLLEKVPFLLMACWVGVVFLRHPGIEGIPVSKMPLIAAHHVMFYLGHVFWPAQLSPYYPRPEILTLANKALLAAVIGSLALLGVLIVSARWSPAGLVGLLTFVLGLLPAIQVSRFSETIAADAFAYFPMLGLLIFVAAVMRSLWRGVAVPVILVSVVAVLAGVEGYATWHQMQCWRDIESLYRQMLRVTPQEVSLRTQLAQLLTEQRRAPEAIEELRIIAQQQPRDAHSRYRLGSALAQNGQLAEGVQELTEALKLKPDLMEAYADLGRALLEQGKPQDAVDMLRQAADLLPTSTRAQFNYGVALERYGQAGEAIERYSKAVQLDAANFEAHMNLGRLLASRRRLNEAEEHFREAVKLQPKLAVTHNNLGGILRDRGKLDEAAEEFRIALGLDGKSAAAHYNLGHILEIRGKNADAANHFQDLVNLQPESAEARYLLGRVLRKLNRRADALRRLREALELQPGHPGAREEIGKMNTSQPGSDETSPR